MQTPEFQRPPRGGQEEDVRAYSAYLSIERMLQSSRIEHDKAAEATCDDYNEIYYDPEHESVTYTLLKDGTALSYSRESEEGETCAYQFIIPDAAHELTIFSSVALINSNGRIQQEIDPEKRTILRGLHSIAQNKKYFDEFVELESRLHNPIMSHSLVPSSEHNLVRLKVW